MPKARGEYIPRRKLATGLAVFYHAVRADTMKSLCGARSTEWGAPGSEVTCRTCLMKLAKATPRRSRTQQSWDQMRARCLQRGHHAWHNYGGRGITICARWMESFDNFLADMGERPEGKSLDRLNPNGNYEPSNCVWATSREQGRNRRGVGAIAFGRKLPYAEWAREYGLTEAQVHGRMKRGRSLEEALLGVPAGSRPRTHGIVLDLPAQTSHYEGCWREHHACALRRIEELERQHEEETQ